MFFEKEKWNERKTRSKLKVKRTHKRRARLEDKSNEPVYRWCLCFPCACWPRAPPSQLRQQECPSVDRQEILRKQYHFDWQVMWKWIFYAEPHCSRELSVRCLPKFPNRFIIAFVFPLDSFLTNAKYDCTGVTMNISWQSLDDFVLFSMTILLLTAQLLNHDNSLAKFLEKLSLGRNRLRIVMNRRRSVKYLQKVF